MRKLIVLTSLITLFLGVLFIGVKIVQAHSNSNGRWGSWTNTSSCVASSCGTSEGTKNQKRTCEYHSGSNDCQPSVWVDPVYQYANAICPTNYHYHNSGNWNERCHRNNNSIHPEHTSPTGCPIDFSKVGNSCRKTVSEGYWTTAGEQTRTVACHNAPVVTCPTPTPTATPTATPTSTPTATPTESGEPTPTPSESASPTPTPSESASPTPTPSESSEPTPTPELITPSCGTDEHLDLSGTKCLKWELGGAPAPAAATGQVLGASTMAGTGVAEDTLFNMIFVLGSVLSAFGLRKFSSSKI